MLITYSTGDEVLICKKKDEKKLLAEYFGPASGRDLDNYDRNEADSKVVQVVSRLITW